MSTQLAQCRRSVHGQDRL